MGATNPKSLVFFAAVLPQFVVVWSRTSPRSSPFLGFVVVLIALMSAARVVAGTAPGQVGAIGAKASSSLEEPEA